MIKRLGLLLFAVTFALRASAQTPEQMAQQAYEAYQKT